MNMIAKINVTDVKKELYKSKAMAIFSHYDDKSLYYNVDLDSGTYQFPIETIKKRVLNIVEDNEIIATIETEKASEDLSGASFGAEVRGSELNRWIAKAIDIGKFKKIDE